MLLSCFFQFAIVIFNAISCVLSVSAQLNCWIYLFIYLFISSQKCQRVQVWKKKGQLFQDANRFYLFHYLMKATLTNSFVVQLFFTGTAKVRNWSFFCNVYVVSQSSCAMKFFIFFAFNSHCWRFFITCYRFIFLSWCTRFTKPFVRTRLVRPRDIVPKISR